MRIADERLEDFITRWEQVFGERLTADEARPIAVRLVGFYDLIRRPIPEAGANPARPQNERDVVCQAR